MTLVIKKELVAQSLKLVRSQKTHSLFSGYLHLQKRTKELGRLEDLSPDFLSFFKEYFKIIDHPLGSPYIRIFTEKAPSEKNLWINENIAGSYAPSSLRAGKPFRSVVNIDDKVYSLPYDHTSKAYKFLLYNKKINLISLAIFIYRDYGFYKQITYRQLIDVFLYDFGYVSDEYLDLYELSIPPYLTEDWMEKVNE